MSDVMEHYQDDGLHEECGVFGMYDFDGHDVARTIYYGLFALQHRGQESCGIAVSDTEGPKGKVLSSKGMGLVNEVFTQEDLDKLKGNIGVGHVRYSTAGASTRENAQPLVLNYIKGTLALAHNGNLVHRSFDECDVVLHILGIGGAEQGGCYTRVADGELHGELFYRIVLCLAMLHRFPAGGGQRLGSRMPGRSAAFGQ